MITFVQSKGDLSTGSANSLQGTFASATTTNNLVIVAIRIGAQGHVLTVGDGTNTYHLAVTHNDSATDALYIYYAEGITGLATHTVTVSIDGSPASIRITLHEYSGILTSGALDKTASNNGTSATPADSGNTATTSQADELLFGAVETGDAFTYTAGTGYGHLTSSPASGSKEAGEDRIVSSTGTYNATFTFNSTTDYWACAIATFKAAAGGSPVYPVFDLAGN